MKAHSRYSCNNYLFIHWIFNFKRQQPMFSLMILKKAKYMYVHVDVHQRLENWIFKTQTILWNLFQMLLYNVIDPHPNNILWLICDINEIFTTSTFTIARSC